MSLQDAIKGVCEMPSSTTYLPFEPTVELFKRAHNEITRLRNIEVHARLVLKAWEGSNASIAWPFADALSNLREALEER